MLLTLYDLIIFYLYPFYLSLSLVLSFLVITLVTAMQQVVLNFATSLPTHARKIQPHGRPATCIITKNVRTATSLISSTR